VVGLSLATELVRLERDVSSAIIGSDCQVVIQATKATKGAPGRYLVDIAHELIEAAQRKHEGLRVELRWTPGHEGIPENERPGAEAKSAAQGESSPRHIQPWHTGVASLTADWQLVKHMSTVKDRAIVGIAQMSQDKENRSVHTLAKVQEGHVAPVATAGVPACPIEDRPHTAAKTPP